MAAHNHIPMKLARIEHSSANRKRWRGAFTVLLLAGLVGAIFSSAATIEFNRSGGENFKKAVFHVYATKGEPKRIATVRIGSGHQEYKRKSFFRIGLLPVFVAEDVEIEFENEMGLRHSLVKWQGWLRRPEAASQVMIRRFAIRRTGERMPCLKAEAIHVVSDGILELQGIECMSEDQILTAHKGDLKIAGPETGRLILYSSQGKKAVPLFTEAPETQGSQTNPKTL